MSVFESVIAVVFKVFLFGNVLKWYFFIFLKLFLITIYKNTKELLIWSKEKNKKFFIFF